MVKLEIGPREVIRHQDPVSSVGVARLVWYPKLNGSHFGLQPSSIYRMAGWVAISCALCPQAPSIL